MSSMPMTDDELAAFKLQLAETPIPSRLLELARILEVLLAGRAHSGAKHLSGGYRKN
jgi:hypothetical protein